MNFGQMNFKQMNSGQMNLGQFDNNFLDNLSPAMLDIWNSETILIKMSGVISPPNPNVFKLKYPKSKCLRVWKSVAVDKVLQLFLCPIFLRDLCGHPQFSTWFWCKTHRKRELFPKCHKTFDFYFANCHKCDGNYSHF